MIYNFVNKLDYSTNLTLSLTRQPLLPQYTPVGANVLYLESPRLVGFSYQDKSLNDTLWNDDKEILVSLQTASDIYLALKDFFTEYPQFSTNDFFVTGESYGGVYVPTLTRLLIQKIQSGLVPSPSTLDPISTDNFGGFQCYMVDAASRYLSQSHVRQALHVPDFVQSWDFCSKFPHISESLNPLFQGAGHFVPTDRPGPALQMISNFFAGHSNYNNPVPFDLTRRPLLAHHYDYGSA
ncbi:serine carboxypeptidase [Ancylostoma ceylanicum]|uniref:Carboxypeptidase n=1 Tax=Ancylostoma ceylanicum TaxID=53326 RepID=A0A0D6LZX1_9BILA|nr:serine carboxypeptidase [Ancylostoma ceylanicum]